MRGGRGHIIQRRSAVPPLVLFVFGLAGLVAFVTLMTLLVPRIRDLVQEQNRANDNRTWLTPDWTASERSDDDLRALAAILSDNGIRRVYLQTNRWHGQTGDYVEMPFIGTFLERFRSLAPEIEVYLWLWVDYGRLQAAEDQAQVFDFVERALDLYAVDGVHLQSRSVPNDSEQYITFLHDLRSVIGAETPLSLTVPPDRRPSDPNVPSSAASEINRTWERAYKERVLLNADEIVLMAHSSGFESENDYQRWLAYQVRTYTDILQAMALDLEFIVALPTFEAELAHDPAVENVQTTIAGIQRAIRQQAAVEAQLDGVGLYPWDQTDLFELDDYWELWVNR